MAPTSSREGRSPFPALDVTTTGHKRIGALTGVRWWAAFGVLLSHNIPGGNTPRIVQSFFEQGNLGVTVFFVLSGFILTYTYATSLTRPTGARLWSFYVARIARVYPLYLLVLLWITPHRIVVDGVQITGSWWAHLFGAQAWLRLPTAWEWNGPAWSVSVEFFFYALFPLAIFLVRFLLTSELRSWIFVAIAVTAVALESVIAEPVGWTSDGTATVFPPLRFCDFFLGMAVGAVFLAARRGNRRSIGTGLLLFWLVWTAAIIWLRTFYYGTPGVNIAYALPAAALILGLAWTPDLLTTRWLATRPMIVLGEASYAFYLIHMSVGAYLTVGLLGEGFVKRHVVLWVVGVVFVTAMAIGLNVMVETPARRLLRSWLIPKRRPRVAVTPETSTPTHPDEDSADISRNSAVSEVADSPSRL